MRRIDTIFIVTPDGYVHSQAFFDVALAMKEALTLYQEPPIVTTDPKKIIGRTLVFGGHLIPDPPNTSPIADECILFNTEQVRAGDAPWMTNGYLGLLRNHEVWDYSAVNSEALASHGIKARHCPLGYTSSLSNIVRAESAIRRHDGEVNFMSWPDEKPAEQDIEVLFVGSLNERRSRIIEAIRAEGIQVIHAVGYGAYRDRLIQRAKLCLNLHFFDDSPFEIFRCLHLVANGKCVVTETSVDDPFSLFSAHADDLPEVCLDLLRSASDLTYEAGETYHRLLKLPSMEDCLSKVL